MYHRVIGESVAVVNPWKASKEENGMQVCPIVNWPLVTTPIEEIINLPWYLS